MKIQTIKKNKTNNVIIKIPKCFDSHCHIFSTGEVASILNLKDLKSPKHLKSFFSKKKSNILFRKEWITGFGWTFIDRPLQKDLDDVFTKNPVAFSRADGHALWFNSVAEKLVIQSLNHSERVLWKEAQDKGWIKNGIALEAGRDFFWKQIPAWGKTEQTQFALIAQNIFLKNGFTHVRDLEGNKERIEILLKLENKKQWKLKSIINFELSNISELELCINQIKHFKNLTRNSKFIKIQGLKFYVDGALGSEGALLSQPYQTKTENGIQVFSEDQIYQIIKTTWQNNLPVSIHAIGDKSNDIISLLVKKLLGQKTTGEINIEHAEIVQEKTLKRWVKLSQISKNNNLNLKVNFHMQPSHWLSDKVFLKSKLGSLYRHVFPWAAIQKNNFNLFWGSDSPIENPSLLNTILALMDSEKNGIASVLKKKKWYLHHICPNEFFAGNEYSVFNFSTTIDESKKIKNIQLNSVKTF